MSDLISRQAAIDAVQHAFDRETLLNSFVRKVAVDALKTMPSAQPDHIRCRDCKYWDKTWTNNWSPDYHYCPMIDGVRKGNFYCADAERRTDE